MKIIDKDLLSVSNGVIIHQVNCKGVFGKGVALAIAKEYPEVKQQYLRFCEKNCNNLFGKTQCIKINDHLLICNIFSQNSYGNIGKHTDENTLIKSIEGICLTFQNHYIYAPYKIGCGLGGGNFDIVLKSTKHLPNLIYCKI